MQKLTIQQAITLGMEQLQQAGLDSDTLKLDCEILLLDALNHGSGDRSKYSSSLKSKPKKTKTWLLTWPEQPLSSTQIQHYLDNLKQRAQGRPVAYITGTKDFWDFSLKVSPDTLIPRPETELLVECALDKLPLKTPLKVLDLGTGSGAIALAIASERPDAEILASDASAQALEVAHSNAESLQLPNIQFCLSDWFKNIPEYQFDLIVSNPPYIAPDDPLLETNVQRFEPQNALLAAENGLEAIRQIISGSRNYLKPGGWLLLEHGYTQAEAVQWLLRQYGFKNICTVKDLNRLDRLSMGQIH